MNDLSTQLVDLERDMLDFDQEIKLLEKLSAITKYRRRSYMIAILEAYHAAVEQKAEKAHRMGKIVAELARQKIASHEEFHV